MRGGEIGKGERSRSRNCCCRQDALEFSFAQSICEPLFEEETHGLECVAGGGGEGFWQGNGGWGMGLREWGWG